jgi:hypothetical protein
VKKRPPKLFARYCVEGKHYVANDRFQMVTTVCDSCMASIYSKYGKAKKAAA